MTHMHREISNLKKSLLELCSFIEQSVDFAAKTLTDYDTDLAKEIIKRDIKVNEMEVEIEEECLKILALYQPVAADLRLVVAILKINNELERMGDLCRNIGKYVRKIVKNGAIPLPKEFVPMFEKVKYMTQQSLNALMDNDAGLAAEVCLMDNEVDKYNSDIISQIQDELMKDGANVKSLLFLMSVCRTVERIGDYATNIAEDVYYMISGFIVRHHHEDIDPDLVV